MFKYARLGEMEAFLPPSHSGWIERYEEGQRLARTTGKPMFINFTGVTCTTSGSIPSVKANAERRRRHCAGRMSLRTDSRISSSHRVRRPSRTRW